MGVLDQPLPDQSGWGKERLGAWAPGEYLCTCLTCGTHFLGDKRARACWPCAVKLEEKPAPEPGNRLVSPDEMVRSAFEGEDLNPFSPKCLRKAMAQHHGIRDEMAKAGVRLYGAPAPEPMFVEAWIGWHLGKDGMPAPMICDHNPGHLAHVTRYRFQVPPDVVEHLTGTRECLMLDKFGNMGKDCREG